MSVSLNTIDQIINFALSIITMQVSKSPRMLHPQILWSLRIYYVLSNVIQLLLCQYIKRRIIATNDQRVLKIKKGSGGLFDNADGEDEVEITYCEYDSQELTKVYRSILFQILMVSVLHYKWKIIQPLLVQTTVLLRNLYLSPLYLAYIFDKPILRPYELNVLFAKKEEASTPDKKRKKEE